MKKTLLMIAMALAAVSCFEKLEFGADYVPQDEPVGPVDPDPVPTDPVVPFEIPALDLSYPDSNEEVKSLVFDSGVDGHIYYRIPAMVETTKGTILAFCEARNTKADFYEGNEALFEGIPVFQSGSSKDSGNIDLVLKRSTDGGATWGAMTTLFDDGNNVCGNPSPVVDLTTGRIWLFWCWQRCGTQSSTMFPSILDGHTRRVLCCYSDDDGLTWSAAQDMTSTLKEKDWTWYATGPCHATQLRSGQYSGRLIIPCNHRDATNKKNYSHCCYSDDLGKTWKLGGSTEVGGNESCIVELSDGGVMTSMRVAGDNLPDGTNTACRAFSKSPDGGLTWGTFDLVESLIDPGCQGAATNYYRNNAPSSTILLSNCHHLTTRTKISISVSKDDGKTWMTPYTVYDNRGAYSDIIELADGSVCVFYECGYGKYGKINPNEQIKFTRLPKSIVTARLGL